MPLSVNNSYIEIKEIFKYVTNCWETTFGAIYHFAPADSNSLIFIYSYNKTLFFIKNKFVSSGSPYLVQKLGAFFTSLNASDGCLHTTIACKINHLCIYGSMFTVKWQTESNVLCAALLRNSLAIVATEESTVKVKWHVLLGDHIPIPRHQFWPVATYKGPLGVDECSSQSVTPDCLVYYTVTILLITAARGRQWAGHCWGGGV